MSDIKKFITQPSCGDEHCPKCNKTHHVIRVGPFDFSARKCEECLAIEAEEQMALLTSQCRETIRARALKEAEGLTELDRKMIRQGAISEIIEELTMHGYREGAAFVKEKFGK